MLKGLEIDESCTDRYIAHKIRNILRARKYIEVLSEEVGEDATVDDIMEAIKNINVKENDYANY